MTKSDSITKIAAALVAFHAEVGKVGKDSVNPHFRNKYASLSNILETVTPVLTACKLAVIQLPTGTSQLETILIHESGEFISEVFSMPPTKQDPQGIGSAITYARRYALGAILSLNIDEDDDANAASRKQREDAAKKATENGVGDPRMSPPALASDKGGDRARLYDEATDRVGFAKSLQEIADIYNEYPSLKDDKDFIAACSLKKKEFVTPKAQPSKQTQ